MAPAPESDSPAASPPPPGGEGWRLRLRSKLKNALARNAAWNWGVYLIEAVVVLFLSPYVVHMLGHDAYGVWAIVLTLTGYFGFADFGIRPAIVYFVARHDALEDPDALNAFVSSAFFTFALGGALVAALALGAAPWLPDLFHIPGALQQEATLALLITAGTLALTLPLNAFSAVLIGRQRFDLSCRIDLVTTFVRTAAIVGALAGGQGLVGIAAANAVAEIGEMIWKTRTAYRIQPSLRLRRASVGRAHVGALLRFGAFNIIAVLALHLTYQTDAIVIGTTLSLSWVTYFTIASRLPFHVRNMLWSVGRVLTPEMGARHARGDHAGVARLIIAASRTLLALSLPLIVWMIVFGPAFLERWMGEAVFRTLAGPALLVLALGAVAPIASYPLVAVHQGTNRMRALAAFSIIEAGLNLGLSLALVHAYGILGVALGTAIPAFLVHAWLMPRWNCKALGLSFAAYVRGVWLRPIAAAALTAALALPALGHTAGLGWLLLIASGMATVLVYGGAYLGMARLPGMAPPPSSTDLDPAPGAPA